MANNTGLDEADIEPGDFRTRLCQNATGLWFTPPAKFRILKIHAAETRPGKRPPRWEAPDFPRQRPAHCPLTLGNVGGSPTPGNHTAETGLAGWGARIRTCEWRNQNPLPYHLATPQRAPDHTCASVPDQSPDDPGGQAIEGSPLAVVRRTRLIVLAAPGR